MKDLLFLQQGNEYVCMKKFFITNLIFLLTLNVFIKSFWILGIDRSVQNALPAGEYGLYYALLNFTYIFNIILDLGITNFNNRTIAQNSVLLKKYFAKIIPLKFILAAVYAIVLFTVAFITRYDSYAMHLLGGLCIFQILTSVLTYLRSNISALLLFKTDSLLSILDKTLTIIFCSVILWTPLLNCKMNAQNFISVQILSMSLSVITALIICLTKSGFIRISWDVKFMATVLKQGAPYALLTLLMSFYNRMDSVMLERMADNGKIASEIYASGFRLVDSVNMIAYLFSVILLPLFAKLIKEKGNITEIVKVSFSLLFIISTVFACLSFAYSNELMQLMYNKHIEQSSQVYKLLSLCFIPVSTTYVFGTLLTANGSLKKLNIVASCGMILNISINILLIPKYSQMGSAVASLSAQTITALLQVIIALSVFKIKVSKFYLLHLLLFLTGIIILTAIVKSTGISMVYAVVILLFCYTATAFACKIFSLNEIKLYIADFIHKKDKN